MKNAIVEWGMPESLKDFYNKIRDYAKWDVRYGIWWHPTQRLMSHNIKALSILLRYLAGLVLLILGFSQPPLFVILLICLFAYLYWIFRIIHDEFGDCRISVWGPILQISSDFAVMGGFFSGILDG